MFWNNIYFYFLKFIFNISILKWFEKKINLQKKNINFKFRRYKVYKI